MKKKRKKSLLVILFIIFAVLIFGIFIMIFTSENKFVEKLKGELYSLGKPEFYAAGNEYTINKLWNATYDSGSDDYAYGIAVDNNDGAYVTGVSNNDYYTIKYNATDGSQIWNVNYPNGIAYDITIDLLGNIYVTGNASNNYTTLKYNSTGDYQWNMTDVNGMAYGISVDNSNNAYVTGVSNNDYYTVKYEDISSTITDTIYPLFSNYADNSGTLTSSGVAWFNVNVENTNGSVVLEISGVNYVAENSTVNLYSVLVSLSSAGTYSYKWKSWGNGTNKNYNASETRNYVVNSNSSSSGSQTKNFAEQNVEQKNTVPTCSNVWVCGNWSGCLNDNRTRRCYNSCLKKYKNEIENCIVNESEKPANIATSEPRKSYFSLDWVLFIISIVLFIFTIYSLWKTRKLNAGNIEKKRN